MAVSDFLIREAGPIDLLCLCELNALINAIHAAALPQVFHQPGGPEAFAGYVSEQLQEPGGVFIVGEVRAIPGRLAGLVHVVVREAPDIPILTPRRLGRIENLVVHPEYRRQGLGQALLETAHKWVQQQGVSVMELGVWEFNEEARALYEKCGYTTASRRMWRKIQD